MDKMHKKVTMRATPTQAGSLTCSHVASLFVSNNQMHLMDSISTAIYLSSSPLGCVQK